MDDGRESQADEKRGALYEEHVLLGASFAQSELGVPTTVSYASSAAVDAAVREGCVLADATGMRILLSSGAPLEGFQQAAFANDALSVGDVAFAPVLLGDGSLASIPLLARSGDDELLAFDMSPRASVMAAWLSFVSSIEQDGFAPYRDLDVTDVSMRLVPLVLWGHTAPAVLGDYVGGSDALPKPGHVASLMLDGRISCVCIATELAGEKCYLLMVPPNLARVIWRSLLSFESVSPVGLAQLWAAARDAAPWLDTLATGDKLRLTRADLEEWGLMRAGNDFIGGRAL
ncbi:MAG: hypothetical protein ACI38Z_09185 [Parafannyhessea sp.]|uniref:hypothetical protein n=1 Tax=Parafannyhessea sp. TaxID=2847324 RepID=UPI003F0DAD97